MSKNIKQIMIVSAIFVRGVMCQKNKVLKIVDNPNIENDEINSREAKELIARGKATTDVEVDVPVENEEDTMVAVEDMLKDDLLKYAEELGIDVPSGATKKEIIELVNALDDEELE